MKKVIYRLQFKIEDTSDIQSNRENKIISLLSTLDNIDTEKQINAPVKGTIIDIDGIDFIVDGTKISFLCEEDIVFYTTIVLLKQKNKPVTNKLSHDDMLEYITNHVKYEQLYDKFYGKK